jgi:hypothetical protein
VSFAPDIEHRVTGQALAELLATWPRAKHRGCQERTVVLALATIGYPCSTDHVAAVAGVDRSTAIRFLGEWTGWGVVRRHFDQEHGYQSSLDGHPVRVLWEMADPSKWPGGDRA